MSEPQAPTEEQVNAANAAEEARWQGDFNEEDLAVPYKRENKEEEVQKDKEPAEDQEEVVPQPAQTVVAPVVTTEDPGDYTPSDYSFDITLKDGKSVTVKTPEEAEKLAEDPENFATPKQLMDFINKQNKMNLSLQKDYDKWESAKKIHDDQVATQAERQERVQGFVGEFQYLVSKGLIPAVDESYVDADWSDPQIAKQPGVKEQVALLNYMVKENEVRAKAGVKQMTSIVDAFNGWQQDVERKKEVSDAKVAADARKAAGARVAGVSPAQQGAYVPKGIAVGNPNVLKRNAAVWDD